MLCTSGIVAYAVLITMRYLYIQCRPYIHLYIRVYTANESCGNGHIKSGEWSFVLFVCALCAHLYGTARAYVQESVNYQSAHTAGGSVLYACACAARVSIARYG